MEVISNVFKNHAESFASILSKDVKDIVFVSPYLAEDFGGLLRKVLTESPVSITLVTTLKKDDQDQIAKPKSLKSFYQFVKEYCPRAKVKIHIDNNLHGKIYIFKKQSTAKAIVTSANLTHNGLYKNHEWGLLIDDPKVIEELESQVLECVEYPDITESLVDRLVMFSDQYQRDNPDWGEVVVPQSDILESVYNQGENNNENPRFWLKPIGVSENPIYKEDRRDFSELHQPLAFSKKGVGAIRAGDIVITTAVGCGCLLSYFQVTGSPVQATQEEQEKTPWKERWPWSIEGRNLSSEYGGIWWQYDLDRKRLLEEFLGKFPKEPVTQAGARTLGTLNFGSDKVEITKKFAEFLIEAITDPG